MLRLYQITNNHESGFDSQVLSLIRMGLDRFGLDIGILSEIKDNQYKVLLCITPEEVPLKSGDEFNFPETYCSLTYKANAPVAVEHAEHDDILANHPAYAAFGLETYIGIPIKLFGKNYGTLNFSSPSPYEKKFNEIDVEALKIMGSWIETELVRRHQEQELIQLNNKIQQTATLDSITGLPNEYGMLNHLQPQLNFINRKKDQASLVKASIESFKDINEEFGNDITKLLLIEVSNLFSSHLRSYDFIARSNESEFCFYLPSTDLSQTKLIISRIIESSQHLEINKTLDTIIKFSFGASHFKSDTGEKIDLKSTSTQLIENADEALTQAKYKGQNQICFN